MSQLHCCVGNYNIDVTLLLIDVCCIYVCVIYRMLLYKRMKPRRIVAWSRPSTNRMQVASPRCIYERFRYEGSLLCPDARVLVYGGVARVVSSVRCLRSCFKHFSPRASLREAVISRPTSVFPLPLLLHSPHARSVTAWLHRSTKSEEYFAA